MSEGQHDLVPEHELRPTLDAKEYDALTALFLDGDPMPFRVADDSVVTNDRAGVTEQRESFEMKRGTGGTRPLLNLLIMGHLPVQSGPWASQYARFLSEGERQSVGLLRLRDGFATVDLIAHGDFAEVSTVNEAAGIVRSATDQLLVRIDATAEFEAAAYANPDRITLLTAGNEMAVVNAYRTLKRLVKRLREVDAVVPELCVVVMGSESSRARSAADRIAEAAAGFLEQAVETAITPEHIEPVRLTPVFTGPWGESLEDLVAQLLDPECGDELESVIHRAGADAAEKIQEEDDRLSDSFEAYGMADPVVASSSQEIEGKAEAHSNVGKASDCNPGRERLASYIDRFETLEIDCPIAPKVELAVNHDGVLQLLAMSESEQGIADAIQQLRIADDWVQQNASLLSLAAPNAGASVKIDAQASVGVHLFTESAPIGLAATPAHWSLHLLARVAVDGRFGFFHTRLR
ncbi:MAG: hypothetical protein AAGB34_09330 [Planctomycetota bacterium]